MCDHTDFICKLKSERLLQNKKSIKLVSLERKVIVETTQINYLEHISLENGIAKNSFPKSPIQFKSDIWKLLFSENFFTALIHP